MSKTVFLGVEGSGKTTLTMALAKAFESHKNEGWYLKPLSRDSFRFLKTLPDTLDGNFPSQTADLRELRWQAEYKCNDLGEIAILDYPGEIYRLAFLDEKDELDPESFRQKVASNKPEIDALLGAIKEADDVFVLFNLADGMDVANNPRNLDAVWVTNECLKLLKRLESKPRIRLIFTQADRYLAAGLDIEKFSISSIDLIGHDHSDVPWNFVSVLVAPDAELGVDNIIEVLIANYHKKLILSKIGVDLSRVNIENNVFWENGHVKIKIRCLEDISAAIEAVELSHVRHDWMFDRLLTWENEQSNDWKILLGQLDKFSSDGFRLKELKTSWGKDIGSRLEGRVNQLIKANKDNKLKANKDNKLNGCVSLFIVIMIVIILASSLACFLAWLGTLLGK